MNVDYMRLTAGAANPDRGEADWEPGYNLVEISVEGGCDQRRLRLRAHVRVWQKAPGGFEAKRYKGSDVWDHSIALDPWHGPAALSEPAGNVAASGAAGLETATDIPPEGGPAMNTLRDVGLRFYRLSFSRKSEIAGRLELLEEEDMRQPDFERFRRVFIRAHERGKLDELADAVRAAEQG
jgi:hypothetical protein